MLIPRYAIRDGVLYAQEDSPREIEVEQYRGQFRSHGAAGQSPSALARFLAVDANDEAAILAFTNEYGTLGQLVWHPQGGLFPQGAPDEIRRFFEDVRRNRLRGFLGYRVQPPPATASDVDRSWHKEPTVLGMSRWCPERLSWWREAHLTLCAALAVLVALPIDMAQRRGAGPHRAQADILGRLPLDVLSTAMLRYLRATGQTGDADAFASAGPEDRLVYTLTRVEDLAASVVRAQLPTLRPSAKRQGYDIVWDAPCLLHLLYQALVLQYLASPPMPCALPTCTAPARANSRWCTEAHATRYRVQKYRAKRQLALTAEEVAEMERVALGEGVTLGEASHMVAARRPTSSTRPAPRSDPALPCPCRTPAAPGEVLSQSELPS